MQVRGVLWSSESEHGVAAHTTYKHRDSDDLGKKKYTTPQK